ncbi:hypothetical protein GMDG_05027 [Pseudogymnoascus destructans 20631-21]|uniref:CBM1 domain-containing protein n=1 Tax=Pseudogymnoascus destructans (strain ATCC MYA-4855 / 20631-21) TaxID=658429 RepID=L8GCH4_PSED2|nr:hypothetical protein GMDG_05027 [Pseudogymnoascus destructans 20631-21]
MFKAATSLLLLGGALATPAGVLEERQSSCPGIHIFGARETSVSPGYGTAGVVVNLVLNAHSGSTAEAIVYPACGGQSSCGGVSYANSVQQGVYSPPRPSSFQCPSASKIKSYCDAADPYCCNGNDANTHQSYGNVYGQQALAFINSQLSATGTNPPTSTSVPTTATGGAASGTVAKYGQCGGLGLTGGTVCASGSTCQAANQWYSHVSRFRLYLVGERTYIGSL